MMEEFEKYQSPHDGGFWDKENFSYEDWLESNQNQEWRLIYLKDGFLQFS